MCLDDSRTKPPDYICKCERIKDYVNGESIATCITMMNDHKNASDVTDEVAEWLTISSTAILANSRMLSTPRHSY